jgi:hypothetical protein
MDLLKKGQRATKPRRHPGGPMSALDHSGFGEIRISSDQMAAISSLYQTNTSMQAVCAHFPPAPRASRTHHAA